MYDYNKYIGATAECDCCLAAAVNTPPSKPQPYSSTAQAQPQLNDQPDNPLGGDIPAPELGEDTNRHSLGSVRDSRDSAFVQLNLLGSFDEELEILQPPSEGAMNPTMNNSFDVPNKTEDLINFDFGQLDALDPLDSFPVEGGTAHNQLDQQQYDMLWDNILSSIPTADGPNM